MRTPIAFFIFNRPDTTARVFAEIARARPPLLLVVADGPRTGIPDDVEKCAATRAIIERVDWDCRVLKNYAEGNLGCKRRVVSGMDWVFEHEEEAIILEDDCLPHPSFFPFCDELLERYRVDEEVMAICGDNYLFGRKKVRESYFFHRVIGGWGWATWRRAWRQYDEQLKQWPTLRETSWLKEIVGDWRAIEYWREIFDRIYAGAEIDTWDYQWLFTVWARQGLAATAGVNLITNIGWGVDATHTFNRDSVLADIPTREITFPLRHPPVASVDRRADQVILENIYLPEISNLSGRLRRRMSGLFNRATR
ncbi:MAG: hypothetical protein QOD75_1031 [Blastocatellia bacterium]|jgi:hypothetical protein|nr:hypothetical protein [Blastocatellia bacterium]